tara:strand:+ start:1364 stop:2284 length:921 start_codon:yes stop_codon:yes gene_type:complete
MDTQKVLDLIQRGIAAPRSIKNGEAVLFCPNCSHRKPKFQINLSSGKSHCWVCNFSSHTLAQLFRKLSVNQELINEAAALSGDRTRRNNKQSDNKLLRLPAEFTPLWMPATSQSYLRKHVVTYLMERNIRMGDVIRYGVGYCEEGPYARRVIIPSYTSSGQLNYFVARDVFPDSNMKYKNPPTSKNVVMFELLINWNEPIVLCEGVFDAIAIKKNSIPLLGKFPSIELMKSMISNRVKNVYLALDNDATSDGYKLVDEFTKLGIECNFIKLTDQDPSDMGFKKFWEVAHSSKPTSFSDMIRGRLYV